MTAPLAPAAYCDPAILAAEAPRLFASGWQLVGHASDLPRPGGYAVRDLAVGQVLLTRDSAGRLRALSPVCRHRAGPVATGSGVRSRLTCGYHGWTYGLDGALLVAPEFEIADLPPRCRSLPSYEVAEAHGFVFVRLSEDELRFGSWWGPLATELAGYELERYAPERHMEYRLACNWKVYVENYLEPYHLPLVHHELHRVTDYERYAIECRDWHVRQGGSPRTDEAAGTAELPLGVGSAQAAGWYWLFPNIIINCSFGLLSTNVVIPDGPNACVLRCDFYVPPGADPVATEEAITFSDAIQLEDIGICEAVQRGLSSGQYTPGVLHPVREIAVGHFAELWRRRMGESSE